MHFHTSKLPPSIGTLKVDKASSWNTNKMIKANFRLPLNCSSYLLLPKQISSLHPCTLVSLAFYLQVSIKTKQKNNNFLQAPKLKPWTDCPFLCAATKFGCPPTWRPRVFPFLLLNLFPKAANNKNQIWAPQNFRFVSLYGVSKTSPSGCSTAREMENWQTHRQWCTRTDTQTHTHTSGHVPTSAIRSKLNSAFRGSGSWKEGPILPHFLWAMN